MSPITRKFPIDARATWKKWRNTAIVLFMLGLLVVCSPVLAPIAAVNRAKHRRRIRDAARAFRCPACGETLGDASLPLAERHWNAELEGYRAKNPGLKFNFIRPYDAACPGCGVRYALNGGTGSFQGVSATL